MIHETEMAGLGVRRAEPIPGDLETPIDAARDLTVLTGVELHGRLNTPPATLLANIRANIRRGHPQARIEAVKPDRVCLVGSGPSLSETLEELRDLYFQGAKVVALNGALAWLVERNIRPSAAVVVDARPSTARFLAPDVPGLLHYVASQCDPAVFEMVARRERVAIWHSLGDETPMAAELDHYYGAGHWLGVTGGTTVASRALSLLRSSGYVRFDLFGVDCCWLNNQHHAFDQVENAGDRKVTISIQADRPGAPAAVFECAPWHVQQLEDFLQLIRVNGAHFLLNVHGRGLLASALKAGAHAITELERS